MLEPTGNVQAKRLAFGRPLSLLSELFDVLSMFW